MNLSDNFVIWQEKLQQADAKNTNVKTNFLVKSQSVPLDQNTWYILYFLHILISFYMIDRNKKKIFGQFSSCCFAFVLGSENGW